MSGLKISLALEGWGDCQAVDVKAVLEDVARHLCQPLRLPVQETICVVPSPENIHHPRTLDRLSPADPIVIWLSARNRLWAKFSYQFSHELCHVVSGHERLKSNPNNWFHETICELASLFTLRRMAETWPTAPPYQQWADYSVSLSSYAEERLQRPEHQLPPGVTLSDWLTSQEDVLRQDRYQREKNGIVAGELLPLFESDPSGWNAIRRFPKSSLGFKEYLLEWRSQVDSMDQPFVGTIIQRFEDRP